MITRSKILFVLLCAAVLSLAWAAPPISGRGSPNENSLPPDVQSKAQLLTEELTRQGFEVLQGGSSQLYTVADCPASYLEMESCFGTTRLRHT